MNMTLKKCNLIIPSSKLVAIEMQNEFGAIPPILIPLMGRITLKKILESYNKNYSFAFVGIQEGSKTIEDYFNFFPDPTVILIRMSTSKSISDTIEKILLSDPIITESPIVLNFADTIIKDLNSELMGKDFISFTKTQETERWTLFQDVHGKIWNVSDKKYLINSSTWKTYIGQWGFSDSKKFLTILQEENQQDKPKAFYRSISRYAEEHAMILHESMNWVDVGHVDNYFNARKQEVNTRFFNKILVKDATGTIVKTSSDNIKLVNELNWLITIPKELRYYVPTIFDFSLDFKHPFGEMEFYSYPSLDDCFVYSKVDLDTWEKIFSKIFFIIKIASKYTVKDDNLKSDLESMYYSKTVERLERFSKENPDLFNSASEMEADGKKLMPLKEVVDSLDDLILEFGVYDVDELQIIHGDLCFSNILYDNKHGLIKLIDPRGQFGRYSIYGDVYYDLAKLSHSVIGLYDLIMFDQFKFKSKEDHGIVWWNPPNQAMIGKIFEKYLKKEGFVINKTRFIEALLFLSMLPLHKDHPNRQHAMLVRGLSILTDLVENKNGV
jgi:hypothetical protein